jgi:vancomycin resistance protein VanJ
MRHIQKTITALCSLACAGLIILSFTFHIKVWPLELILSMTPQLLILSSVVLSGGVIYLTKYYDLFDKKYLQKYRIFHAVLVVGLVAWLYAVTYSFTLQSPAPVAVASSNSTFRFATYNTLFTNTNFEKPVKYLLDQEVDVAVFQEVGVGELRAIQEQLGYPYGRLAENASESFFGSVGIISRLPVRSVSVTPLTEGYAIVRAEIETPSNQNAVFYGVHLTAPFSGKKYRQNLQETRILADMIAGETLPVIVGGDFNTTVFSPKLQEFNRAARNVVKPITSGGWPQCSWVGYGPLLCMRIDQVYIPKDAALHGVTISPDLGSDHRMIVTELSL